MDVDATAIVRVTHSAIGETGAEAAIVDDLSERRCRRLVEPQGATPPRTLARVRRELGHEPIRVAAGVTTAQGDRSIVQPGRLGVTGDEHPCVEALAAKMGVRSEAPTISRAEDVRWIESVCKIVIQCC